MNDLLKYETEDRFDIMWYSINRLTMLLYPQWSGGTEVQLQNGDSNLKFKIKNNGTI